MGRIFESFKYMKNENEADVNQNFIIPLLTKFLGFKLSDIKPERNFSVNISKYGRREKSSKKLPKRRRPDFVVCIDSIENPKFVVESKKPDEDLEEHLTQMRSYAVCVGVNLLVITNGKHFKIYDVHELLFMSEDLKIFDIQFDKVFQLLSRETHEQKSLINIIQSTDLSINSLSKQQSDIEKKKIETQISDYKPFLEMISREFSKWHAPKELGERISEFIEPYPPDELHSFSYFLEENEVRNDHQKLSYKDVESKTASKSLIIVGESGIGKTSLLKYLTHRRALDCINLRGTPIPIYIQLRHYSQNRDINKLILNFLQNHKYKGNEFDLVKDIHKKQFIFFLDGYDEIQEEFLNPVNQELEELIENTNNQIIITTRKFRQPSLPSSITFSIRPLDNEKIEIISEKYLSIDKYEFISNINFHGLEKEASNTLLLTFMIILFQTDRKLPNTTMGIIEKILDWIKKLEEKKGSRFQSQIEWRVKINLLSHIAFELISKESSSFDIDKDDDFFVRHIVQLKRSHVLSNNLNKNRILSELESTGLILQNNTEISFWHRAFLDYFAGIAIAEKIDRNCVFANDLKNNIEKTTWVQPIKSACRKVKNPDDLIREIYLLDKYLAAECICENNNIKEGIVAPIIKWLKNRTKSPIHYVRVRALDMLRRIGGFHPHNIFQELTDSKFTDVKMFSLMEFAKTKSQLAKKTVYKNIDWDEVNFFIGSTQGTIARCLVYFDEEDHLKIVDIWKKKVDLFTDINCTDALLAVVRSGNITDLLKDKLIEFYLEEINNGNSLSHKDSGIAQILSEINDVSIISRIVRKIDYEKVDYKLSIIELLAGFTSIEAIEYILKIIVDTKTNEKLKEICSSSLSKSKAEIDVNVFISFLKNQNPKIRRAGVNGLKKYPSSQIKAYLLAAVNDEDAWVQHAAIETLSYKGLIYLLAERTKFPKIIYLNSLELLLKEIQRSKIVAFLPFILRIKNKVDENKIRIEIINALLALGRDKIAKEIVENFYSNHKLNLEKYDIARFIEISPNFNTEFGIRIINDAILIIEAEDWNDHKGYWYEKCIEALEKIGSKESIEKLIEFAKKFANEKHPTDIERTLRALVHVSPKGYEKWLMKFFNEHPELNGTDLNRALELLGVIGTLKSIPLIHKIAQKNKSNEHILDTCSWAIEYIYGSQGIRKNIDESDIF